MVMVLQPPAEVTKVKRENIYVFRYITSIVLQLYFTYKGRPSLQSCAYQWPSIHCVHTMIAGT
jgi:hypothetical protein